MRKRRTAKAARGRPNKCVKVKIGGVWREVCFDSKGRVRRNVKVGTRKRK